MPDKRRKADAVTEGEHADKVCAACGRRIQWRKKWERDWEAVRFCSDGCRVRGVGSEGSALEAAIVRLLGERGAGKTICPSEAARAVRPEGWEGLMEAARAAARRLVASGQIVVTQGGVVVDASTAKGAIRLRLLR